MSKQIYIYGLGGAEKQYVVIAYKFLIDEDISIDNIVYEASMLKIKNPSIKQIYAIDNHHGLRRSYLESVKEHSIESCAIFKDILERRGIKIQ